MMSAYFPMFDETKGISMNLVGCIQWIVFGALTGFGASFIFGDLMVLPVDIYYLIYFVIITAFFVVYVKKTGLNLKEWVARRLIWGILLGLVFGALLVKNVLSRPDTERFAGAYLAWLILWRGLIYGAVDGLLLSSFPWIVTWRAFDVEKRPWVQKVAFGFLAWVFVLVTTTAYHAGYSDFRSRKLIQPNVGNTIISIPTLISANPVASAISHAAMHIAAVIHSPKTDLYLPPHRQ